MKSKYRAALLAAAFVLLVPLSARSEIKAGSFEVSSFAGYNFFENRQNPEDSFVYGGRFGYNFTKNFGVEATGEYIESRVDNKTEPWTRQGQFTSPIDDMGITFYNIDLVIHFNAEANFNPFIVAGYGAAHYRPEINGTDMAIIESAPGIVLAFDGKSKPATTPVAKYEPKAEPKAVEPIVILVLKDVHFDFDKSTLTKQAKTILKKSIELLKQNPKAKIHIAGYTSASGTKEYNQKLSERRAMAVYDYLAKEKLVPPENLITIGYGEMRPAMYEPIPENIHSEAAKANMMVLFEVMVKQGGLILP